MNEIVKLYDNVVGEIIEGTKKIVFEEAQRRREDYYKMIDEKFLVELAYNTKASKPKVYTFGFSNNYYICIM